jgi:hypothetical protein
LWPDAGGWMWNRATWGGWMTNGRIMRSSSWLRCPELLGLEIH